MRYLRAATHELIVVLAGLDTRLPVTPEVTAVTAFSTVGASANSTSSPLTVRTRRTQAGPSKHHPRTRPGEPVLQFNQHCQPRRGQQLHPGYLHDRVTVRDRPQVLAQLGDSRDIDLTGDRHQRRNRQREGSNP